MKYTYKQDMAIYDDLSAKIDAIKPADTAAIEETLKPIGEHITAVNETVASVKEDLSAVGGSLSSIEEKVSALAPVNYEELAERVAQENGGRHRLRRPCPAHRRHHDGRNVRCGGGFRHRFQRGTRHQRPE